MKDETKEAYKQLERDLLAWARDKIDLEAAVVKMRAEIDTLHPTLTNLREKRAKAEYANKQLEETALALESRRDKLLDEAQQLLDSKKLHQEKLDALLLKLRSEKVSIDADLERYETDQRLAVEDRLGVIRQQATNEEAKLSLISDACVEMDLRRHELEEQNKAFVADATAQRDKLAAQLTTLASDHIHQSAQHHRLAVESADLMSQLQDLRAEHAKLKREIDEFKVYEDKAWAGLRAVDASLQEREQRQAERENLRPPKSFLPPTDA